MPVLAAFLLAAIACGALSAAVAWAARLSFPWIFLAYVLGGMACLASAALVAALRHPDGNRGAAARPGARGR